MPILDPRMNFQLPSIAQDKQILRFLNGKQQEKYTKAMDLLGIRTIPRIPVSEEANFIKACREATYELPGHISKDTANMVVILQYLIKQGLFPLLERKFNESSYDWNSLAWRIN